MSFLARRPRAPLDTCVDLVWTMRATHGPRRLERVLPTATAQVVVNLADDRINAYDAASGAARGTVPAALLAGPRSRFDVIDTDVQWNVVGACVAPGGLPMLLHHPADALCEIDIPLDALWDARSASRLRERLLEADTAAARLDVLEAALLERYRPRDLHPAVTCALDTFLRRPAVARVQEVVRASGFSARYLVERFKAQVGLPPKRFCRVRRFQLAVARAHGGTAEDWALLALDCGFYDQAHLVNEFRDFAGLPPSAYLAQRTPHRNHVTFLQAPGP